MPFWNFAPLFFKFRPLLRGPLSCPRLFPRLGTTHAVRRGTSCRKVENCYELATDKRTRDPRDVIAPAVYHKSRTHPVWFPKNTEFPISGFSLGRAAHAKPLLTNLRTSLLICFFHLLFIYFFQSLSMYGLRSLKLYILVYLTSKQAWSSTQKVG